MARRPVRLHWGAVGSSFSTRPCWQFGVPAGQCFPIQQAALQVKAQSAIQFPSPQTLGKIGKSLNNLPPPHTSLRALNLNINLLTQYVLTPVAGRTALFLENWARLTQDPWVLPTVKGYQIPLKRWPDKHWSTVIIREEQHSILQDEVAKLREKKAVHPV